MSVEFFTRGLKPDVEQRLENARDMEHIVQNAIKPFRVFGVADYEYEVRFSKLKMADPIWRQNFQKKAN